MVAQPLVTAGGSGNSCRSSNDSKMTNKGPMKLNVDLCTTGTKASSHSATRHEAASQTRDAEEKVLSGVWICG